MSGINIWIPPEIADEVSDLAYLDREVEGAFIYGDDERYSDEEDYFVSTYVITGVGEPDHVDADRQQEETLEKLQQQTDFNYSYFHTHPLGSLEVDNANLENFSDNGEKGDVAAIEWGEETTGRDDYFELLVYPSREQGKKAVFKSSQPVEPVYRNWEEDDGTSWTEVEKEVDQEWERIGGKVIEPHEESELADRELMREFLNE